MKHGTAVGLVSHRGEKVRQKAFGGLERTDHGENGSAHHRTTTYHTHLKIQRTTKRAARKRSAYCYLFHDLELIGTPHRRDQERTVARHPSHAIEDDDLGDWEESRSRGTDEDDVRQ